jgi:hypothetical protein
MSRARTRSVAREQRSRTVPSGREKPVVLPLVPPGASSVAPTTSPLQRNRTMGLDEARPGVCNSRLSAVWWSRSQAVTMAAASLPGRLNFSHCATTVCAIDNNTSTRPSLGQPRTVSVQSHTYMHTIAQLLAQDKCYLNGERTKKERVQHQVTKLAQQRGGGQCS